MLTRGEEPAKFTWHESQAGAAETGETPLVAWQFEQLPLKAVCVAEK